MRGWWVFVGGSPNGQIRDRGIRRRGDAFGASDQKGSIQTNLRWSLGWLRDVEAERLARDLAGLPLTRIRAWAEVDDWVFQRKQGGSIMSALDTFLEAVRVLQSEQNEQAFAHLIAALDGLLAGDPGVLPQDLLPLVAQVALAGDGQVPMHDLVAVRASTDRLVAIQRFGVLPEETPGQLFHTLSVNLSAPSRREEALAPSEEAVTILERPENSGQVFRLLCC